MLELYHHGSSVCAAKVRLCLEEKGLEWQGHYVDILKGEQFDPAYRKLNPKQVVPTLVHDGRVVRESTLICEYLDDVFPDPPLKPVDPYSRLVMRLWTKSVDEDLHAGAVGALTYCISHRHTVLRMPKDEVEAFLNKTEDPAKRERKRRWVEDGLECADGRNAVLAFDRFLGDMENCLSESRWLAGDEFTLADIAVVPYVMRLEMLAMSALWEVDRAHVTDWLARAKARPSFQPALFKWLPEALLTDLNANGAKSWPEVKAILEAAKG